MHVNSGSSIVGAPSPNSEPPGRGARRRRGLSPLECKTGPFAVPLRPPAPLAGCCTESPHPRTPLPRLLPESSRCIPRHSLGVSHAGLQPAPKGVYTKQSSINTGAAPRSPRSVARRSTRAPLTGEMSPPFLPFPRASPGRMGGRGWQVGEERTIASSHRDVRAALWMESRDPGKVGVLIPITRQPSRRPNSWGRCTGWDSAL